MRLFFGLVLLFFSSCASHDYISSRAHRAFEFKNYDLAARAYEEEIKESKRNRLLFQLDLGLSHFYNHDYKAAIRTLLKAEQEIEKVDYFSLSEEAGVLVSSSNSRTYLPEEWERVIVNLFLALSFAVQDNPEEALVEVRKFHQKWEKISREQKKSYRESPFALYLSSLLWASQKEWDSALLDGEKALSFKDFPMLKELLLYWSRRASRWEKWREYKKKWPTQASKVKNYASKKNWGYLQLFFLHGQSPVKTPRGGEYNNLPEYKKRTYPDSRYELKNLKCLNSSTKKSEISLDLESSLMEALEEKMSTIIGARVLRTAVKGGVAVAVAKATKSKELGWLAFYLLMLGESADLRSWQTLPAQVQSMVCRLPAGKHTPVVVQKTVDGRWLNEWKLEEIEVKRDHPVFRLIP